MLLGTGESGKSTLFKQMKILYGDYQMNQSEMDETRLVIFSNILDSMHTMLERCEAFGLRETVTAVDAWEVVQNASTVDPTVGAAIEQLWSGPEIQETWTRRNEYNIIDSIAYFFDNIIRVSSPGYMCKSSYSDQERKQYEQDYLYARQTTTNIHIERLSINNVRFEFIDVGGQKSERRRWLKFFGNVTAVLFIASLSDYNTTLVENPDLNRYVPTYMTSLCDMILP